MISIIIPAHNEAAVIARSLQTLLTGASPDEFEIIVVCNGCSDNTAEIARRFAPAVRVLETEVPGKTNALNLGDAAAHSFPRIYLDADVLISLEAIRTLAKRLADGDIHAVAPTPVLNVTHCSRLVRAYYAVRSCLPSARQGIGGSGVYALSAAGRARFSLFPNITADDAYVRLQFLPAERATMPYVHSTVYAPRTLKDLLAIRTRIYYGIAELAHRFPETAGNADVSNNRALIGVLKQPTMWTALITYTLVNTIARCRARLRKNGAAVQWTHDQSSRRQVA
jgi:glycosyltransferase involved in cell wall biosynthesis